MPYSVGLQSAATAFLSAGFATQFTVAVIAFLAIILITSALEKEGVDAPKFLPGYSLFHIIPFFRRRYDFLNEGFHTTGQNAFQFKLLGVGPFVIKEGIGTDSFPHLILPEYGCCCLRGNREADILYR
jgi:sterol 14-demethylase